MVTQLRNNPYPVTGHRGGGPQTGLQQLTSFVTLDQLTLFFCRGEGERSCTLLVSLISLSPRWLLGAFSEGCL